jgi:hypothetical protein
VKSRIENLHLVDGIQELRETQCVISFWTCKYVLGFSFGVTLSFFGKPFCLFAFEFAIKDKLAFILEFWLVFEYK